jgi:hypothetical protein
MIKGTSATLGARHLAERSAEIERLGQAGGGRESSKLVDSLEAAFRTAASVLKAEHGMRQDARD